MLVSTDKHGRRDEIVLIHYKVINNASTRLDTADLIIWRSAGLHISDNGLIVPSNDQHNHQAMQDDMISNALIWLVMKLVNFVAAEDSVQENGSPSSFVVRQKQQLEDWEGLEMQLNVWYDGLPDDFRPSAMVRPESGKRSRAIDSLQLPKKWFARPMCASTMQWYSFAKIQLQHSRPLDSSGLAHNTLGSQSPTSGRPSPLAERHASLQHGRKHAEEIISIGLAQADEGARVHSVQPLYAAGQLLGGSGTIDSDNGNGIELSRLRACVLNLLRDIERDTGWATDYRVSQLLTMWQLPAGWGEDDRDGDGI